MRKLVIMVVLMLGISITLYAQQLFNVEAANSTTTENWDDAEDTELTSKILINYADDLITVFWEENIRKYYVRTSEAGEGEDGDRIYMVFSCVDSEGLQCTIIVTWFIADDVAFNGLHDYSWKFYYDHIWYTFYANELE